MVASRASRASRTVALASIVGLVLVGCDEAGTAPDPAGTGSAAPTPTGPEGEPFGFCGIIDLSTATEVGAELGVLERLGAGGQPVVVSSRRVVNAGSDVESELCRYGTVLGELGFSLQAYPARERRDIPDGAQPREELGADAYFLDAQAGRFTLTVPAADAYLSLTGVVGQTIDAADAEDGLARLLLPAAEQVPPGAVLAGLAGGEECDQLAEPVARALDGEPEFSRHTEIDASFVCEFTTSASGRTASVGLHRGVAGAWEVNPDFGWQAVDGLAEAWQDNSGVILAFVGEDVVRVHMLGIDDGDGTVDQDLAAEAVSILTA